MPESLVLLVDADTRLLSSLTSALQLLDLRVVSASDETTLDLSDEAPSVAAVCADGPGGWRTIDTIRGAIGDAALIVTFGEVEEGRAREHQQSLDPADAYLRKPFSVDEFVACVSGLLDSEPAEDAVVEVAPAEGSDEVVILADVDEDEADQALSFLSSSGQERPADAPAASPAPRAVKPERAEPVRTEPPRAAAPKVEDKPAAKPSAPKVPLPPVPPARKPAATPAPVAPAKASPAPTPATPRPPTRPVPAKPAPEPKAPEPKAVEPKAVESPPQEAEAVPRPVGEAPETARLRQERDRLLREIETLRAGSRPTSTSREMLSLREVINEKEKEILDLRDQLDAKDRLGLDEKNRVREMERARRAVDEKLLGLEKELINASERIEQLTQERSDDAAAHRDELARQKQALDAAHDRELAEAARSAQDVLAAARKAHEEALATAADERRSLEAELDATTSRVAALEADLGKAQAALAALEKQEAAHREQAARALARIEHDEGVMTRVRKSLAVALAALDEPADGGPETRPSKPASQKPAD